MVSELRRVIGQKVACGTNPCLSFNALARGDLLRIVDDLISQRTRYSVPPAGKDGIILLSFVLTQYKRVTDRHATANTAPSIAAPCKNLKSG